MTVDAQWAALECAVRASGEFSEGAPIICARAPGRLDVLGGVSDYSGGTVLEMPLAAATLVAAQPRRDSLLVMRSDAAPDSVTIAMETIAHDGAPLPLEAAASALRAGEAGWSAYAAGCLYALMHFGHVSSPPGFTIHVVSDVPLGAGVSSSAALEVAAMSAFAGALGITLEGLELARVCQWVENRVVGAPCGIMDQVTCALGRNDSLLALKCQPHELLGYVPIPASWRFVGINSGVKHSVGGSAYARARIGSFMGLKVLQTLSVDSWGGYLCNVSPLVWRPWRERIPLRLTGADFLRQFGELPDTVVRINPDETYAVRDCAEHPILENDRARELLALLGMAAASHQEPDSMILTEAGKLMLDSHASYSERIHLGSEETDLLVTLAMNEGPDRGIFGAKITGGGSGGTVAILCSGPAAGGSISRIREEYRRRTGIAPGLLQGASPGAVESGLRKLTTRG